MHSTLGELFRLSLSRKPKQNLEEMSEDEIMATLTMLEEMGYRHVLLTPSRAIFTVRTSDGKEFTGMLVRDDGPAIHLETKAGTVVVMKTNVTAISRAFEVGQKP